MRFVFVDNVCELEPGRRALARYVFSGTEALLDEHFDGYKVVPGVILVEMMAQVAGVAIFAGCPGRGIPIMVKLERAEFRDWALPDTELEISAEVLRVTDMFARARCSVRCGSRRTADSSIFFGFVPRERFGRHYLDAFANCQ